MIAAMTAVAGLICMYFDINHWLSTWCEGYYTKSEEGRV